MITLQEMSMLSTLYTQPHRHYHNLNHINECLVELENFPGSCLDGFSYRDHRLVTRAIWYHDAVYNPYSKNNEVESAVLIQPTYWMDDKKVADIIRATAKHLVTQPAWIKEETVEENEKAKRIDVATQVMLDIDLAGFGKPTQECLANGANIRKEYYKTNDREFAEGRLKFLRAIMQRESLYYTDFFKEKYHEQSQKNLKIEEEIALEAIDDWSGM